MERKIYDRIVGKIGHDTKTSKIFSKMVDRFNAKKALLKTRGYQVQYVGDIDGTYTPQYEVTFPDKHREYMTQREVEAIDTE